MMGRNSSKLLNNRPSVVTTSICDMQKFSDQTVCLLYKAGLILLPIYWNNKKSIRNV